MPEKLNLLSYFILMKKILALCLVVILLPGCKKAVQKIQQNLIIDAMTDGEWKVTSFTRDGTNITADFSTYTFRYYSDRTVDAKVNGTVQQTGSWDGDMNTQTTWAEFISAVYPLALINGTWKIDRNSWTFVEATQEEGGHKSVMRLDKL